MTHERLARVVALLADARTRYAAARRSGDDDGARYAAAECRRLRRMLAEV